MLFFAYLVLSDFLSADSLVIHDGHNFTVILLFLSGRHQKVLVMYMDRALVGLPTNASDWLGLAII